MKMAQRMGGWWIAAMLGLTAWLAGMQPAAAQFTVLHTFTGGGQDGSAPRGDLTASGATLYGMANAGGAAQAGVVFKLGTDGSGYTNLHAFAGGASDGAAPWGSVTLAGGSLYGMTLNGGTSNAGVLFNLKADGSSYTVMHVFGVAIRDAAAPYDSLLLSGSTLYGLSSQGGVGNGALFTCNTNGGGYAVLKQFTASPVDSSAPYGSLRQSGSTLFGMTHDGGAAGYGVIFQVSSTGAGYTNLHSFGWDDGADPYGSLTLSGSTLYGVTCDGGANGYGVIFRMNSDGTGYTNLHSFARSEGTYPNGTLTLVGSTLYGMTQLGGASNYGTIFAINSDGSGFTKLHDFAGGASDGAVPDGSLTQVGSALYGMTSQGGAANQGVVFALSLATSITSQPVSLFAPTNSVAQFSAGVFGPSPMSYQWFKNGVAVTDGAKYSGSTTAQLSINNAAPADATYYNLVVSNVYGVATSAVALLVVGSQTPAATLTIDENTNQTFSLSATDPLGGNLMYSWSWNGATVTGNVATYTRSTVWGDASTNNVLAVTLSSTTWSNLTVNWTVTITGDNNGDGAPNWWDLEYGFDPNGPSDALTDTDSDGLNNLMEYIFGSNPLLTDTDGNSLNDYWAYTLGANPTNQPLAGLPDLAIRQVGAWTTGTNTTTLTDMAMLSSNLACLVGYDWSGTNQYGVAQTGILYIVNIAIPTNPSLVSVRQLPGGANAVAVKNSTLYIGMGYPQGAVQMVDCSNPAMPVLGAQVTNATSLGFTSVNAVALSADGATLYATVDAFQLSDNTRLPSTVLAFDVTNPSNMTYVSSASMDHRSDQAPMMLVPNATSVFAVEAWTNSTGDVVVQRQLDVIPANGSTLSPKVAGIAGRFAGVAIGSNYLYGADSDYDPTSYFSKAHLSAYDISNPTNPVYYGSMPLGSESQYLDVGGLTIQSNLLLVAGWPQLSVYRIDSPTNLVFCYAAPFGVEASGFKVLAAQNQYLVATWEGFNVYTNGGRVDTDQNGLPDWWEMEYFGHLGVDPNATAAGGLFSNWAEYQLGNPSLFSPFWGYAMDPTQAEAIITVQSSPTDGGSVTGSGVYLIGSNALLTATASNGWNFLGWSDGTNSPSRVVPVTGLALYTANFSSSPVGTVLLLNTSNGASVLTLNNPSGSGVVTNTATYVAGSTCTVTAISAAPGAWRFMSWNDGSVTNNPWSFVVAPGITTNWANMAKLGSETILASPAAGGVVTGSGQFPILSNTLITATAMSNYRFTQWSDGDTNSSRMIVVPNAPYYNTNTAYFVPTAVIQGTASTNAGGNVTGGGVYDIGSTATLTATASNGWRFIRWSNTVTNNPQSFTVTEAGGLTAIFQQEAYIGTAAFPANGGSVTGADTYLVGSNATLTATPASSLWRFTAWNDYVTDNPRTVVVAAGGATYTANFSSLGYVTVLNDTNGAGTFTLSDPSGSGSVTGTAAYVVGSNCTLTAVSRNIAVWRFMNWNGSVTNNPWTFSVSAGYSTNMAYFQKLSSLLVVANPANGGTVTGSGIYPVGASTTITATALSNYRFSQWNDGNTNNSRSVLVTPNYLTTNTAYFVPTAVITVAVSNNVGGSVTGGNVYDVNSNAYLTATASNNWQFVRWSDGTTANPRTVRVTASTTYTALFSPTALITVQANPSIGGRVTGGGTFVISNLVTIAAFPSNNWRFVNWSDGTTTASRTVMVPVAGASYTANFVQRGTVTVNVVSAGAGTVTMSNPTTSGIVSNNFFVTGAYDVGSTCTVTAVSAAPSVWQFMGWNNGLTNITPWTFIVPVGNSTNVANFQRLATVTVTNLTAGGGTVTGSGTYLVGSSTNITATPTSNWIFQQWSDYNTNANRSITVPSNNITYMATFTPPTTVYTAAYPTNGGSAAGGGFIQVGSNITLTATPAAGWVFTRWSDGTAYTNPVRSVTVPASTMPITYTAMFAPGIAAGLGATNLTWTTGGASAWNVITGGPYVHPGSAAAVQNVTISNGQQTWFQTTVATNGNLQFWWNVSSAPNVGLLQFYTNNVLVSQISGTNGGWQSWAGYIGSTNPVTLKWQYTKAGTTSNGWDVGWVGPVTWLPQPYVTHAPQTYFQTSDGQLASWVLSTNGTHLFTRVFGSTPGYVLKAAGDIDGDGVSDLVFQNSANMILYWFMNADGSLRSTNTSATLSNTTYAVRGLGDYMGTGRPQIFVQNPSALVYSVPISTNGTLGSPVSLGTQTGWTLSGVGDMDGNGKADLIWENAAGTWKIWYSSGNGAYTSVTIGTTPGWVIGGIVDVDGDGTPDIIWQNPVTVTPTSNLTVGYFMVRGQTGAIRAAFTMGDPTITWMLRAAGR